MVSPMKTFEAFDISRTSPAQGDVNALLDICFGAGRLVRAAERLREGNQAIDAYTHCAVDTQGRLVGAISFWPICIGADKGLLLGPLAVHPETQGQGIGLALMQQGIATIEAQRFAFVMLVGDLPYYARVGFEVAPLAVDLPGPFDVQRLLVKGDADVCARLAGLVRAAPELC